MSQTAQSLDSAKLTPSARHSFFTRLEAALEAIGDRLNPILVKEARQAMKSRQFVVTFSLLLLCGWLWTLLFIVSGLPAIYYAPVGPGVLRGYYVILSVPLLIVVPYAAFRSLAGEWEDGTFELLSITALSARQIITGKLASAALQMMVYYSALAPCIAFTYLLRGIDIITVALLLGYSFAAAVLLSAFGLMMATVTRVRHWQVLLSVVLVMALLVVTIVWDMSFLIFLSEGGTLPIDQPDFWIAHVCGVTFYVPVVLLLLFVAAGQITFASENRSTPIRVLLLLPHALLAGWFLYLWHRVGHEAPLYALVVIAGGYWMIAGTILTGETAQLSPRALRRLPQSFLGRMLFTWFNPGSATGYVFAVLNLLAIVAVAVLIPRSGPLPTSVFATFAPTPVLPAAGQFFAFAAAVLGYVAGYLGLTHLLVRLARRFTFVPMPATFLCHVILVIVGILGPLLVQRAATGWSYSEFTYSLVQLPNWAWTLVEIGGRGGGLIGVRLAAAVLVPLIGGAIFLLNFVLAAREVTIVRQAAPQRVVEDDLARHPLIQRKRHPWDEAPLAEQKAT